MPKRRAGMLDEGLAILTAAWSGEPVQHRGEFYTVDGMRFLPRPVQRPGVPVWVAGFYGKPKPLRRAARYQGFFPVNLEHPDQLAEIVAGLTALRRQAGRDLAESFDVVAALPPHTDPAPYRAAGATWWVVDFPGDAVSVRLVREVVRAGPAHRASHHPLGRQRSGSLFGEGIERRRVVDFIISLEGYGAAGRWPGYHRRHRPGPDSLDGHPDVALETARQPGLRRAALASPLE